MNQEDSTAEIIRDSRATQLQSCRQRIALFKGLQVDNYEDRATALEKIIQVVKSYIRSSLSPITTSPTLSDHSVTDHTIQCDDDEYSQQLFYFLLTILRLSISCPYSDVRQTFRDLLTGLKETTTIAIPQAKYKSPSYFIPLIDIFSLESNNSTFQQTAVLYPRSSNLSFSPWSCNNSVLDEPLTKKDDCCEQEDPSMPNENIKPKFIMTKPSLPITASSSSSQPDFTGGRPSDEYVRQMMIKTFTDEGRLANLFRVLSFFPTFFEIYHVTYTKIVKGNMGPLHRTWKSYIGLMVAAEQRCQYLFSNIKIEFLYNGGDPNWLRGLDYVPHKLRKISVLISKLARQPWKLESEDIQQLLSGGIGDSWSRGELVQATLIIATFLGLSSFILGCGITPEIDMTGGFYLLPDQRHITEGIENELDLPTCFSEGLDNNNNWQHQHQHEKEDSYFSSDHGIGLGVTTVQQEDINHTEQLIHTLKSKKTCTVKEQLLESLEKMKIQDGTKMTIHTDFNDAPPPPPPAEAKKEDLVTTVDQPNKIYDDLDLFVDTSQHESIELQIFDQENDQAMEFMLGEYCWEDHGCDLANHYLPGIGDDLVQEFTEAISITDWSIFHPVVEDVVDTSPLRYAIWYYTQKIMGVTKEDYNYSDIPTYLNDRTTKYIQTLCMSPSKIQTNDWLNIGISLRPEEKCHVNLLIASARKQAVLCYGLCLISEV